MTPDQAAQLLVILTAMQQLLVQLVTHLGVIAKSVEQAASVPPPLGGQGQTRG